MKKNKRKEKKTNMCISRNFVRCSIIFHTIHCHDYCYCTWKRIFTDHQTAEYPMQHQCSRFWSPFRPNSPIKRVSHASNTWLSFSQSNVANLARVVPHVLSPLLPLEIWLPVARGASVPRRSLPRGSWLRPDRTHP